MDVASFESGVLLVRASCFTMVAACVAQLLLTKLAVRSPKAHRITWLLVILQGWLVFTVSVPWHVDQGQPVDESDVAAEPIAPPDQRLPYSLSPATHKYATSEFDGTERAVNHWGRWLIAFWFIGALAVLGLYVARCLSVVRHLPLGEPVFNSQWRAEWHASLAQLQVRQRPQLRTTGQIGPLLCFVPFVYLVLVPRVLWQLLSCSQRRAILHHELAHLTRGDLWKSAVIRLLAIPQWFNPGVWWAVRRFDEAGEWACDELVMRRAEAEGLDYPAALLQVAEFSTHTVPWGTAAYGGRLSQRIQRLLTSPFKEESKMKKMILPALMVVVALIQLVRLEVVAQDVETTTPPQEEVGDDLPAIPSQDESSKPTESVATELPAYIIEPPDILLIDPVKLVPKPPIQIEREDVLAVRVPGAFAAEPIAGLYIVDASGRVELGASYGRVKVSGMTTDEARAAIDDHLKRILASPDASVSLASSAIDQQISGQHLVKADGRINLGVYGTVHVARKTIDEAREAVEKHLSKWTQDPKVVVDVFRVNSKNYWIVTEEGDGRGRVAVRPITGNETVMDAVASIGGISRINDRRVYIARTAPDGGIKQILEVDWEDIKRGYSETNYQLLAGDRLFIDAIDNRGEDADAKPPTQQNVHIEFTGNSAEVVPDSRLRELVLPELKELSLSRGSIAGRDFDECVDRITAHYRNLGFFDARVGVDIEFTNEGKTPTVRFIIDEGERWRVRSIEFSGNKHFASSLLSTRLTLSSGDYLNLELLSKDHDCLRGFYANQGYVFADIKLRKGLPDDQGEWLNLEYVIEEGKRYRVGDIRLELQDGNANRPIR